ncbi:hypothetical protein SEPCBS57363_003088 [Sporothrix epigloea]|uniref:ATP-binding protein n=1 Tax=Sporothrix epigloea TaxID=1892477 RepID=A0ABP0DJI5_9PEZI
MSALQSAPAKFFIQMSGAPGSGKSTLAKLIRPSIGGVIIDHDVLRSSLLEADLVPFDEAARQAYILQWNLAHDIIKQGLNIIVDSTCNYPEILAQGSNLASEHNYVYWYVECKTGDINLLDQRLRNRDSMTSQRTAVDCPPAAARDARVGEDPRALFHKWIENPCRPERNTIIVDSTCDPEMLRDQILKQIVG